MLNLKINILPFVCILTLFSPLCSSDGYPRKRQKIDEQGSYDQVDVTQILDQNKENIRQHVSSRIEELCILAMHKNKLDPDKFHKVLQRDSSRYYKDAQGRTWWDHAKFVNNHDLLQVLVKNQIPMHY